MTTINIKEGEELMKYSLTKKVVVDDVMLTYIKRINQYSWFDKATTTEQMKLWRKLARQGIMKITEKYDIECFGKMYYCFVVQSVDEEDDEVCTFGTILGKLYTGYTYAFRKEQNRDATMNYVMKGM